MDESRQIARGPGDGKCFGVVGQKYRLLATGEETGERYTLIEAVVPPGDGPPPHEHANEDEAFYLIDGSVTFTIGQRETRAEPGTFVLVPRGTVHAFRNPGPGVARMIIHCAPAGMDRFFQEVGIPIADPHGDPPPATVAHMDKIIRTAPKYGMHIHLPTQA